MDSVTGISGGSSSSRKIISFHLMKNTQKYGIYGVTESMPSGVWGCFLPLCCMNCNGSGGIGFEPVCDKYSVKTRILSTAFQAEAVVLEK